MGWVVCISTVSREEEVNDLYTDSASVLLPVAALSVIHSEEGLGGTGLMVPGRGLFREALPSPEDAEEILSSPLPAGHRAHNDDMKQLAA